MANPRGLRPWQSLCWRMKDRLSDTDGMFPFPALFAFGLVLILTAHLFPGLNPRIGTKVNVLRFEAAGQKEGSVWLGVYPDKDNVVVVTADRQRFTWPKELASLDELKPFILYLQSKAQREVRASALQGEADGTQTKAVLALDQALNFDQVRPIIYALAQAKLTRYGFETLTAE